MGHGSWTTGFDAPNGSSYSIGMRSHRFLTSAGIALGIFLFPSVGAAQTAPMPTDSLIRMQLEVIPLPVSPRAQWTLPQFQISIAPVPSKSCPMPVLGGEKSGDSEMVTVPTPGSPAVPMPGAGARVGSYCTNPLRPQPAVPVTP